MRDHHIRHLPVVRDGHLVGLITSHDLERVSPSPITTLSVGEAVMAMQPWWHNLSESHASVQFIHRWLGTLMLALVVWLWLRTRGAAADATIPAPAG